MGEMAAAMAHELNQPLAAVVNFSGGCLRRMRSGKTQGDDLLEAMQQICDQSQRASEVLRRIGGFVGQTQSERAPVDPRGVLETVAALMDPELRANQVKAEFRVPDETPLVLATSIEIEQVLLNLAKNAIEAMLELPDAERELTVELSCSDPEIIEIAVSDRGEGFAEGAELRPFDPFFTTKSGGLGMGLAISRTIVEAHGGRIWTESNPRGGATVRLTLPTLEEMRQDAA